MLALALTSVLLMPTFAFTSTFGFTFNVPRPPEGLLLALLALPLGDDVPVDAPGGGDVSLLEVSLNREVSPAGAEELLPGV
jgi:ABC-type transport system involved in cytochrome c biogenesis permease component